MSDRSPTTSTSLSQDRGVLTRRQVEIVRLVAEGLSDKQIARRLQISDRTVEAHLANVRNQLGLQNRAQIAVWSIGVGEGTVPLSDAGGHA